MILSGTLQLDPVTHAAATATLVDRLADLEERRRTATSVVDDLLASWHGDAASAFRGQWEAWSRAATAVVDDLGAGLAAVRAASSDIETADERRGVVGDHLRGRLGSRLP
jgi:WXG100 family type VII secretion target